MEVEVNDIERISKTAFVFSLFTAVERNTSKSLPLCFVVPGEPDKELNPKKKVWEQVQPDLRTDEQCVATYKGAAFEVAGKGVCKAQTMSNSGIK